MRDGSRAELQALAVGLAALRGRSGTQTHSRHCAGLTQHEASHSHLYPFQIPHSLLCTILEALRGAGGQAAALLLSTAGVPMSGTCSTGRGCGALQADEGRGWALLLAAQPLASGGL